MKKIILVLTILLSTTLLTGCLIQKEYDPISDVLDTIVVRSQTAESFDLVLVKDNVELTWTSNSNSIKVEGTTAVVTQGPSDVNVVLDVKAKKGELEGEKSFNVKVVKDVNFPTTTTIKDSYDIEDESYVKYLDVTVLQSSNLGTYFTDGTDLILSDIKNLEINSTYEVVGMKVTDGVAKLQNTVVTPIIASSKTLSTSEDSIDFSKNGYYKITGELSIKEDYLYIDDYKINSSNLSTLKLFVNNEVTIDVFVSNDNEVNTYVDEEGLNLSNSEIINVISNQLVIPEFTKYNLILEENYLFDSTIEWTTNNSAITTNGIVTRGDSNIEVTLSAKINYKDQSIDKEFKVIVIDKGNDYVEDLFISEYYESSSNKYIEIYNPTNLIIELEDYSIKSAVNEKAFSSTYELSGQLNPNETIVITQSTPKDELVDVLVANNTKYLAASIINFNGDDAIGLFKDNVLVDIFGIEKGNKILNVTNGTTEDARIVRVKYTSASTTFIPEQWYATSNKNELIYDNVGKHSFV